jgi:hypothetical protein
MDTTTASGLLIQSLTDLCNEFNRQTLMPLLEADVTAFLYHRLILNGCSQSLLYNETRICGVDETRKYDIVIGNVNTKSGCVKPMLIIQVKCFPRWGKTSAQLRISFQETMFNDVPSLETAAKVLAQGRFEVITDFFFTKRTAGYLSGEWGGEKRIELLAESCKDSGANLIWVRPNNKGDLEVKQIV